MKIAVRPALSSLLPVIICASMLVIHPSVVFAQQADLSQKLQTLKELHDKGLIDAKEYSESKARLLDGLVGAPSQPRRSHESSTRPPRTQSDPIEELLSEGATATSFPGETLRSPVSRTPDRPTKQEALVPLLGNSFLQSNGRRTTGDRISRADKIGIYFSARWCQPCQQFTPILVKAYNEMKGKGLNFEVVFVSSDKNEQELFTYMREKSMPWLALQYGSSKKDSLSEKFAVKGIPTLIIVDASGRMLSNNARQEIADNGADAWDLW